MPAGIDKSVFAGRGQSLDPARRTEGYQMTELSDGYFDVPAEKIAIGRHRFHHDSTAAASSGPRFDTMVP
jgi:hypothetical protein